LFYYFYFHWHSLLSSFTFVCFCNLNISTIMLGYEDLIIFNRELIMNEELISICRLSVFVIAYW
jgi:hypothetical protein